MIPYHGMPITPLSVARRAVNCGHAFVSHRYRHQLDLVLEICQSFAVDNGAFSAWKSGKPVVDWTEYYQWVDDVSRYPSFDFAVIPDVIDGDEQANDALLAEWPFKARHAFCGAPVWHMHESISRLQRLAHDWPRVCIGSSGDYATVGNQKWWTRMMQAFYAICDDTGRPICKVHGLRMLNPKVFSNLPLSSADSTNIARNVGIDVNWKGTYTPASREMRAEVMRERIELKQSALSLPMEVAHLYGAGV